MASLAELPTVFPVFPLTGAILFPRTTMPLNIFEPRYLQMVRDAQAGAGLIGMIQPRDPNAQSAEPPIYDVGCAGRLAKMEETDDGRYLISLEGVCRFRVREELDRTTPYRQVLADFDSFNVDLDDAEAAASVVDRSRLQQLLQNYLGNRGLEADWDALAQVNDEAMINALAMLCPFDPAEKQALLEEPGLSKRADTVMMLLQFGALGEDESPASPH